MWHNLRNAIIMQAIDDYKGIVKGEKNEFYGCNLKEIERFFKSENCAILLIDANITGSYILESLHKWREEYEGSKQNN